jgi:hypothetical protein
MTHELKMGHGVNHASSHYIESEMSLDTPQNHVFGIFHFMPQIPLTIIPHNGWKTGRIKTPNTPDSPDNNKLSGLPKPSSLRGIPSTNTSSGITKNSELNKVPCKNGPKIKTTSHLTLVFKTPDIKSISSHLKYGGTTISALKTTTGQKGSYKKYSK